MSTVCCFSANCMQCYETDSKDRICGACGNKAVRVYKTNKEDTLKSLRREADVLLNFVKKHEEEKP